MSDNPSIFEFDWEDARGLDLRLIEWESRVDRGEMNLKVLELSQALYSAFSELRKIRKILSEGQPGKIHSYYQFRFELFAHNHFLSIATTRVLKILQIGWPEMGEVVTAKHDTLIDRVTKYRNCLEHQTELGQQKSPPKLLNNVDSKGFLSEGYTVTYAEIEELLNDVIRQLEILAGSRAEAI